MSERQRANNDRVPEFPQGGVLTIGESLGLIVTDGPLHEQRTRVGFGGAESNSPSRCAASAYPSPGSAAWATTPSVTSSSGNCAPKASPSSPPAAAPTPPA